jgi:hypothetical protein
MNVETRGDGLFLEIDSLVPNILSLISFCVLVCYARLVGKDSPRMKEIPSEPYRGR